MRLWILWWEAIWYLRPGCARLHTFLWFAINVAGMTIRSECLGVTSLIRALGLHAQCYDKLLDNYHSPSVMGVRVKYRIHG